MAEPSSTDERLERLERAVGEIQRTLAALVEARGTAAPAAVGAGPARVAGVAAAGVPPALPADARLAAGVPSGPAAPLTPAPSPALHTYPAGQPPRAPAAAAPRDWWALGTLWIGRAGLTLLAVGLAYLFRYAVVRGWLTPPLRVGLGLLIGAVLAGVGSRLQLTGARRAYGVLLLGGGVGILYLSSYAAFGFYQLLSAEVALAALSTLTLLTLSLAASRQEPLLAQVGALGAFAAPLLVHTATPSIPLLAGYIVLVTAWAGGVAIRRGWRTLAWTTFAGAALLLVMGGDAVRGGGSPELVAAAALAGLGLAAGALWRERRAPADPHAWPRRGTGWLKEPPESMDALSAAALVLAATALFPLYATAVEGWVTRTAAAIYLGEAAALALVAWQWRGSGRGLALRVGLLAAAPLLIGTLALELREVRGLLALEALGFLLLGSRLGDKRYQRLGDATFAFTALLYISFAGDGQALTVRPLTAIADAIAIGAAYLARSRATSTTAARLYGAGALGALLVWLLLTLGPLQGGAYWTTISWGVLGTALLLAGYRRASSDVRSAALVTLALVAGKLLLVDTARLPPGGRIVVFMGFGALFVVLAGLYRRRAMAPRDDAGQP